MACLDCGVPLPRQFLDDPGPTGFCDKCREKCYEDLARLFKKEYKIEGEKDVQKTN